MESLLLTLEELISFNSVSNLASLSPETTAKLTRASEVLKASYIIDKNRYDKVYITSDIHCDLAKLHFMLTNAKLVKTVNSTLVPGSNASEDGAQVIHNLEWVPERTLLLIVGDIVDGRRSYGIMPNVQVSAEIPDAKGNIELLLHAYLYNLRIKAQLKNSEIRFTIGNHDYHSLIKQTEQWPEFYWRWVHKSSQDFFGSRKNRRNCLLPFYNCCPYLFIAVSNEIACIHGGLLGYRQGLIGDLLLNNHDRVLEIQQSIDAVHSFSSLTPANHAFLSDIEGTAGLGKEFSPLWSRAYQHFPAAKICPLLTNPYKIVVVGHCQMAVATDNS